MVTGDDIRNYVEQLNITAPPFALALAKEGSEQTRMHILEAQYELCASKLGFSQTHRLLVERAVMFVIEVDVDLDQVDRVNFEDDKTTLVVLGVYG